MDYAVVGYAGEIVCYRHPAVLAGFNMKLDASSDYVSRLGPTSFGVALNIRDRHIPEEASL